MTVLKFTGKVTVGNRYRVASEYDERNGSVWIDDRDVIDEIYYTKWAGPVTVAFADQRFDGELFIETGFGYSEYTPMDPDELRIGSHDVLDDLIGREGEELTLWVADEPVNLLDTDSQPHPSGDGRDVLMQAYERDAAAVDAAGRGKEDE